MKRGVVIGLRGRNFSGRTAKLRAAAGPYLGPEISTFLSGFASTVQNEISLGGFDPIDAIELFGLKHLADRNPFTLSGGEQVLVAAAAIAVASTPVAILDCSLEQLDDARRISVVEALRSRVPQLMIADNALDDLDLEWSRIITMQRPDCARVPPDVNAEAADLRPHTAKGCVLELRRVSFAYRARCPVLDGADLALPPGRVIFFEGHNGVGKSTLAKVVAGILRPSSGAISSRGRSFSPRQQPGSLVAYHHQDPDVQLFADTVRAELGSATTSTADRLWTVQAFGLHEVLDLHPLELPFTLRKRVALAVALSRPCPWYILDEPTLGQDSQNSREIARILARLADHGAGVIAISHSPRFRALFPSAHRVRVEAGKVFTLS